MSIKPRFLKSITAINNEPKGETTTVQSVLIMDISGMRTKEIAKELGMTDTWISIMKNSPMYKERKEALWGKLKDKVVDKRVHDVTGHKVKEIARKHMEKATKILAETAVDEPNAFARNAAYKELRDVAGLKKQEEMAASITIDKKLSDRLNRIMDYDECGPNDGGAKITITKKVTS